MRCARPELAALGILLVASALASCSLNDGIGTYLTDPGRFSAFHCRDFAKRLNSLINRQKELRDLMDKASEGGGGAVIGTLAYRAEYEKAVGDEKILRRTAAEKKCELGAPTFESDRVIR
jgi:hypothetical protein